MSISKGTAGAINEIRVAMYLMILGWQAFRSISPNGNSDLVALKGRATLRVQVKASLNGQYKNLRCGNNDLLAIVSGGDQIRLRARSKKIARMFPSCGIARPPKKPLK